MPACFLFKTEPSDYSFEDLVRDGRTRWEGVRNAQALIHLRKVRKGDPVLIYHTGAVKAIVGLARAGSDAADNAVDVIPDRPLKRPVTMPEIRKNPKLKSLDLVRNSRLSVMPVPEPLWGELLRMSET
ncbi:MAG TPA: EVE domain-containing protein [Planctomycetota bacterium]|nr:EVE domain-containing protein [Planctomycetota bacterium]